MGEMIEFRKPSPNRPTKVRKALDAVAFVDDKQVLGFRFETAANNDIRLEIDAVPEAKQLYDYFNGIFNKYTKQGIESGGLRKAFGGMISINWFLEEEKVSQVAREIEQKMGTDWGKAIDWLFEKP